MTKSPEGKAIYDDKQLEQELILSQKADKFYSEKEGIHQVIGTDPFYIDLFKQIYRLREAELSELREALEEVADNNKYAYKRRGLTPPFYVNFKISIILSLFSEQFRHPLLLCE